MLRLKICAPAYRKLPRLPALQENIDSLCVGDMLEVVVNNVVQRLQNRIIYPLVEELKIVRACLHNLPYYRFQKGLGKLHIACKIAKRHLWLYHPELGQVARRVGVFRSKGGAKGINIGEGERE